MSARVFTIKPAPPGAAPKNLREALILAEKTGEILLPKEALALTVTCGRKVEVAREK